MRIAGLVNDSIVDGPGIRFSVFAQGCPHKCPGCHNPSSHDPMGGSETTVEDIIARFSKNPLLDGVTITGGEPFFQAEDCSRIAKAAHEKNLNVWTYTGYTYEQLTSGQDSHPGWKELLMETDVLVDGRFMLEQRSLELNFRGSRNQRLIDVKKTLETGEAVLWQEPKW
jgi:anaerobic ribonucleoside-triphosphate reductase activating protein